MQNPSHKRRDRTKENFNKSCKSGAARLNKLNQKYNAQVYLQVQWKGRYYEYRSSKDLRWLKIGGELEMIYPLPAQWTPANFIRGDSDASEGSSLNDEFDKSSSSCDDQKALTSSSSGQDKPHEARESKKAYHEKPTKPR